MTARRRLVVAAAAALLIGCSSPPSAPSAATTTILDLLVATEAPRAGYHRDLFGDYDRRSALQANLALWPLCDGYYSQADAECYLDAGDLDVDHIVPLAEAWDSGAFAWQAWQRELFGKDTENLWLMTDNLNQAKGDGDPAEWVPPNGDAVCDYVQRYVAIKIEWHLAVDEWELAAIETSCPT